MSWSYIFRFQLHNNYYVIGIIVFTIITQNINYYIPIIYIDHEEYNNIILYWQY